MTVQAQNGPVLTNFSSNQSNYTLWSLIQLAAELCKQ